MKKSKAFRLDPTTIIRLEETATKKDTNETEIVERAITLYNQLNWLLEANTPNETIGSFIRNEIL